MVVARGLGRLRRRLGPPALALLLGGCAAAGRPSNVDPLLGPPVPTPPVARAPGAGLAAPSAPQANLAPPAPVPAPAASSSPAALAQTSTPPFDPAHDLRISDPRQPAASNGWQNTSPPVAGIATGATLQPPPRPESFAPVSYTAPVPVPAPCTGAPMTYEQALAQLTARGVTWYRLEMASERGPSKFTCSIANPNNANISRVYEAQAADYLSAMRAVLDQISQGR